MFNQVQASLPAASLNDVQRVVPKPLLSNLGWLLRVIFLLEDKPSAQFRVQRTLGQLIWSKDVSVQNSMMVPPPCFTTGMILARWWAWHFFSFAFRPKSFIFVLDRPEIFFIFHGLRVLQVPLANSLWAVMCLLLRSCFHLTLLPYRPDWLSFCSPQSNTGALSM